MNEKLGGARNMKIRSMWSIVVITLILMCLVRFSAVARESIEKIPPDPKALQIISKLMTALAIPDENARCKALMPYLHWCMLNKSKTDLAHNYKAIIRNRVVPKLKKYGNPPQIHEVHRATKPESDNPHRFGKFTTYKVDRYYFKSKDGEVGGPVVFWWPDGGGDPKVLGIGL